MNTTGLPIQELCLVQNAKAHGVNIASVNISAMNYGPCGIDMGQAAIDAANQTLAQLNGVVSRPRTSASCPCSASTT